MSQQKRKQNYVDSHVQGSLLRRIIMHWLSFFLVCSLTIVLVQTLIGDPHTPLMDRLSTQFGEFKFFAIVMAALLPAFMLDTIRFSNRFVGPIGRLRRHLRELGDGTSSKCEFRGSDFWRDMANEFNVVVERIDDQDKRIAELEQQLAESQSGSVTQ